MSLAKENAGVAKRVAVYAGTFDPLTFGHEDIVRRASGVFDTLVVAIAHAHHKKTWFDLQERKTLAASTLADYGNVQIEVFSGLLRDFVRSVGAGVLVRGIRGAQDMGYELQLAELNKHLMPNVETVFLASAANYQCISSTYVREIARLGGEVDAFVNAQVASSLYRYRSKTK